MHGVVKERTTAEKEAIKREEELKRINLYTTHLDAINKRREEGLLDEETLFATQKLLEMNPEFYSLWNLRRVILEHFSNVKDGKAMQDMYSTEMKFLEAAIKLNTKCYWIWHHRRWITERLENVDWKRELGLCAKLLDLDLRNFHCWSYLRFVYSRSGETLANQFKYTTVKIEQNFSNYSAWHQRSSLLTKMYETGELLETLKTEFEIVRQAVYTEPNDSSPWTYHRWLIGQSKEVLTSLGRDPLEFVREELTHVNELLSIEPEAKWPLLTSCTLMMDCGGFDEKVLETLDHLKKIDSLRKNYYEFLTSKTVKK
eukprot:TRINITY_DN3520_c0_g1_i1.p1 TRINITY_DN3520_c0_g1~~TRINITY_DN3520_c0_g1_i1.p1  ORF type:complete len:314 (-),score=44.74 TRINITY_DN3520_c0_g1_i1:45-986(-)